jgi:hypothetical protein
MLLISAIAIMAIMIWGCVNYRRAAFMEGSVNRSRAVRARTAWGPLTILVGILAYADTQIHKHNLIDWDNSIGRADPGHPLHAQISNEPCLVVDCRVGCERIIEAPIYLQRYVLPTRADGETFGDFIAIDVRSEAPSAQSHIGREGFIGEKGKTNAEWFVSDFLAHPLLFLQREWPSVFKGNQPSVSSDIDCWTVSNVSNFEGDRNARPILIEGEPSATQPNFVDSYPSPLTGHQGLFGDLGGSLCGLGGILCGIRAYRRNALGSVQKIQLIDADKRQYGTLKTTRKRV